MLLKDKKKNLSYNHGSHTNIKWTHVKDLFNSLIKEDASKMLQPIRRGIQILTNVVK